MEQSLNIELFLSSTEALLDKLSKELQSIKNDLDSKCPKCDHPKKKNGSGELWCVGCAMLINACKCK